LPIHQRLCDEISYIINKKIKESKIEVGHITSRAKALGSFCEKIDRKSYEDPFEQISDLSGVRVVYLYLSDKTALEKIIETEFDIHTKEDKVDDHGFEKFGYGALHYVVSLKEIHAGARYDDLREARCEIQVRTILQDAWAIVAHHLSYKHENDIPNTLKRKLHAISGLFETADDQFERINVSRIEYQKEVKQSIDSNSGISLDVEINLDNLLAYMSWKFPDRRESPSDVIADFLGELKTHGYTTLKLIDDAVNRALPAMLASEQKYPPQNDEDDGPTDFVSVGLLRGILAFTNQEYLNYRNSIFFNQQVNEFRHLVK
jgi:putative GTP pyrophosphokinase